MKQVKAQLEAFVDSWHKISVQYELYAKKHGLSYTAFNVLYHIYRDNGTCTQTGICEKTMLPKQTIHSVILSFVKNGTVLLTENPEDRRSKCIVLSDKGKAFCEELFEKKRQHEYEAMTRLTEEDRAAMLELLREYANALEKEFL